MRKSFTLIELMIVVAIIAIIAAIAIPGLLRARISSNETSAVGSLRTLSTAENQFQNSTTKDRDLDGVGEYGFFVELAGQADVPRGTQGSPASPTFISSVFGATSSSATGLANKSGYNFLLYLPVEDGGTADSEAGVSVATFALPTAGTDAEEVNNQETRWACYSWPTSAGNSGNKAYFVNQAGEVIATSNIEGTNTTFTLTGNTPDTNLPGELFDAAGPDPDNLDAAIVTGTPTGGTGLVWNPTN